MDEEETKRKKKKIREERSHKIGQWVLLPPDFVRLDENGEPIDAEEDLDSD